MSNNTLIIKATHYIVTSLGHDCTITVNMRSHVSRDIGTEVVIVAVTQTANYLRSTCASTEVIQHSAPQTRPGIAHRNNHKSRCGRTRHQLIAFVQADACATFATSIYCIYPRRKNATRANFVFLNV